jgi:hypothetical protein
MQGEEVSGTEEGGLGVGLDHVAASCDPPESLQERTVDELSEAMDRMAPVPFLQMGLIIG